MVTGSLDARRTKTLGGKGLLVISQENRYPVPWMNDTEVLGFVPGKYSIHRSLVCGGNTVQSLSLLDLVNDFLGIDGGGANRHGRNQEFGADGETVGCEMVPGFQFIDGG